MIKGESESEFKASWEKHRRPSCSLVLEGSCLEGSLLVAIRKMVVSPSDVAWEPRYSDWTEANKTVSEGNNRRMDGFSIKVYHERSEKENPPNVCVLSTLERPSKVLDSFRDGRSFREVLSGKPDRRVSLTSDIPSSISIFVNGKISHIRVVVSEYEDERAWIVDESSTNSIEDESGRYSDDSQDEFNEEHLCDNNERNPQPFAEIPSPRGESNNVDVNSLSELGSDYANNANRVQIQTQNLYQPNISLGLPIDGVLLDVPVNQVQELSRNSSNHSDSVAPIFDRGSGLFTVKPKLLKKSRGENFIAYRSKFDRFQNWVVNSIPHGRTKGGFSSGKRQNRNLFLMENSSSLHSLGMLNSSPIISISGQKDSETDNQIEARNSVEVCSTLGLRTASDNFVAKRFSEITRENERST
ncbi:hypothetical protein V6N11_072223 [Hibiscus sabdariffa]|uniref:Uncharacterized protein n=1 Tax=Hibiscus sabdariffa TaxID=183260 RepID=A0ABR2U2T8_9ROSI